MTPKRIVLSFLTLIVALEMGASLISSFGEPQVGSQLQLYQTDLLVQASEWQGSGLPENEVEQFRRAVFGEDALVAATEQYQEVRQEATTGLARLEQQLQSSQTKSSGIETTSDRQQLAIAAQSQRLLLDQIDLRLGMVKAQQGEDTQAVELWQQLAERPSARTTDSAAVAGVLARLWQNPPVVTPEMPQVIDDNLRGWYRTNALQQFYAASRQADVLSQLEDAERSAAERTLIQLSTVTLLPSLGGLAGTSLLIALLGQRLLKGKSALLALPENAWPVPWNWEVVWQVIVGGFLFVGQIALPLVLQIVLTAGQGLLRPEAGLAESGMATIGLMAGWFPWDLSAPVAWVLGLSNRGKALYSLVFYVLMAASTLGVMYGSIKDYLPLSKDWFRVKLASRWPLWGLGGYLVALPLMLVVSLLNQQIWQGQGGNNPILQLVLEERDPLALGMFLFTAAVAAPIFEETLFRGFLLPSLTRYMPVWGAIGLSSLIFSVAHLSFSEVLPLTVLGAVLGFVYVRSRNLLSSILLHSAWNSITMLGLFLLGSGGA